MRVHIMPVIWINTYRLATTAEVDDEVDAYNEGRLDFISDQTARTIASWHQSPGPGGQHQASFASGSPVDINDLIEEVERDGSYEPRYYAAMNAYLGLQWDMLQ